MGFMSGNLGFSSTIGAAIGGAAKAGNELLSEQRTQERQDDLMQQQVWMNKADNAAKQWNDENKSYNKKQEMWKSVATSTKNPAVADAVMNYVEAFPKIGEDPAKFASVVDGFAAKIPQPGQDYKSPYLQGLGQQAQSGFNQAQAMRQRLNPKYQGMAMQPNSPFAPDDSNPYMQGQGSQPPQGMSPGMQMAPQASQSAPTASMTNQVTGVAPSPQRTIPGSPGAPVAPMTRPSQLDTSDAVNSGPNDPNAAPIPLDQTPGPGTTMTAPGATITGPPSAIAMQPGQQAQANPQASFFPPVKPNHNNVMTPYEQQRIAIENKRLDQTAAQKPASPDEAVDNQIRQHSANKNIDDYLGDLYKRKAQQGNVSEISNDANDFIRMLQTGDLKTGAAQPFVDGVNRILSSMGADDLQKYGLANSVNNTNEAGKIIGRLMFGQIPNYHLGRWTDREFATLNRLIPEMGKDPNTNLKIALLLKSGADRSANSTRDELAALGTNANRPDVSAAMKTSHDYMNQSGTLPWISINTSSPTDDMKTQYNQLPQGGYWEDARTGVLHIKGGK